MKFLTAVHTDVGTTKQVNQDALLLLEAESDKYGEILFAAVCDGMGGLEKGELASAELTRALDKWFRTSLPKMLESGFEPAKLQKEWEDLVRIQASNISEYGYSHRLSLGTTLTALLIIGSEYYVVNVGDSRTYLLTDTIYQITRDHTLVQREIDLGNLTEEQAVLDPRRSVLLQCIGASDGVTPEFFAGPVASKQVFLLCCDGFRHVINASEIYDALNYKAAKKETVMQEKLVQLTETIKQRGESDNISAIVIRVI